MADYPVYSYDRDPRTGAFTPPSAPITPFNLQQAGSAQLAARGVPYPLPVGSQYGASYPSASVSAPRPIAQPEPQPFNLTFAPPPAVNLPPLSLAGASTNAAQAARAPAAPRAQAPISNNGLPKGVPANAIPVIRGLDLSYDIPGTGQRLYPTLNGGVSEYSPDQRLELARYTEPANINAQAGIREAGIRAGAELGSARLAQEGALTRQRLEITATPRPFGAEAYTDPNTKLTTALPTYGVPVIGPNNTVTEFTPIGAAAQRAKPNVQIGDTYNAPDGNYGRYTVKDKKIIKVN